MSIVESDGPPSWSLDASETGEPVGRGDGITSVGVMCDYFFRPPWPSSPLPTGILYSPQFPSHEENTMAAPSDSTIVIYVRSHGKVGDREQSTMITDVISLTELSKMSDDCCVSKFLPRSVDFVFKFLPRSVDWAWVYLKSARNVKAELHGTRISYFRCSWCWRLRTIRNFEGYDKEHIKKGVFPMTPRTKQERRLETTLVKSNIQIH